MSPYLERARRARAVKARVLNGGGEAPAARRETPGPSAKDAGLARHDAAPPAPGPRLPADRPKPAT